MQGMDREGASRSLDEEDLGVWEGGLGGGIGREGEKISGGKVGDLWDGSCLQSLGSVLPQRCYMIMIPDARPLSTID